MRKATRLVALLSTLLIAATTLAACGGSSSGGGTDKDTLAVAVAVPLHTFDPVQMNCGAGRLYCQAVYDTLLHPGADGTPEPGMAASFEYDEALTTLTLELRQGITFSDGTHFDAMAAKAAIDWFKKSDGQNAAQADSIREVVAQGADRLVIRLKERDPGLLLSLTENLGMMAPLTALKSPGIAKTPVGSGPYLYNGDASQSGTAVFDRNEDYWDKKSYPFDHLELVQLADPNTLLNALKVGQIDAATLTGKPIESARKAGLTIRESAGNWLGLVIADRAGTEIPALGEVKVRQAINMALDRDLFVEELAPDGTSKTTQIFAPGSAVYDDRLDDVYEQDVARAKQLMSEAGYAGGFAVTMPDLTAFTGNPALPTALEQQLGELNIKVTWKKVPVVEILDAMRTGEFPMFFMSLGTRAPWQNIQLQLLPSSPFNPFKSHDPELDELLAAAKQLAPGPEQDEAFRAVNTWLVDNAWFAPAFAAASSTASTASVKIEPQVQGLDLVRFKPAGR